MTPVIPQGSWGAGAYLPLPRVPLGDTQIVDQLIMPLDWHISLAGKAQGIFNDLSPRECRGIQCEAGLTQPGLKGRRSVQPGEFTGSAEA